MYGLYEGVLTVYIKSRVMAISTALRLAAVSNPSRATLSTKWWFTNHVAIASTASPMELDSTRRILSWCLTATLISDGLERASKMLGVLSANTLPLTSALLFVHYND